MTDGRVSIRAPRAGRDAGIERQVELLQEQFLSARPGRGATLDQLPAFVLAHPFLSARPGRGATLHHAGTSWRFAAFLSARPGRGATPDGGAPGQSRRVSIRAPRAGRDAAATHRNSSATAFLSARPGRGATARHPGLHSALLRFYPRAPGGARHAALVVAPPLAGVSIRAPRAGRDHPGTHRRRSADEVSIRAPRAGRDLGIIEQRAEGGWFLSARPGRGAT